MQFQQEIVPKIEFNPSNDFREQPVHPSLVEIRDNEPPELSPILEKGQFVSLDHYLDTNWRLLREDFICDLRIGLKKIKEMDKKDKNLLAKKENLAVSVYNEVFTMGTFATSRGYFGLELKFVMQSKKHRSWVNARKLLYGQLLIFSNDNF